MSTYNLVLFGVKETTKLIAEYLHEQGIQIDLIVSINPSLLKNQDVANYFDLSQTAKTIDADYHCVTDYGLKKSQAFFETNQFRTGLVYGWQRLIPDSILYKFSIGVFGFHASPDLLPQGRGRSPLNWALILGKTRLYNHCFRYAPAADAGPIHSIMPFSVNPYDNILTLLYKSLITAKKQLLHLLNDIAHNRLVLNEQAGDSYFFPKRTPDEGLIDFTQKTSEIINLVRGVSRPFSGAFSYTQKQEKITIWEAWPFDNLIDFSDYQIGEVIDTLYDLPLVKTIDGSIILKHYEGRSLKKHDCLGKG